MTATLKTSAVTFCHSSVDQLIDHHSKSTVAHAIEELLGEKIDARSSHRMVRTTKDASFLRNPHVIQLAAKGAQRHWMFLTQLHHQNVCLLIERFIKKTYAFPKMLLVAYQFNEVLYQNTLLEVDVVETAGGYDTPLVLVSDLAALKNRNIRDWDPIKRHNVLHTIFEKQFYDNMTLQPCAIQVKTLYPPSDWPRIRKDMDALPYRTRGLVFLPLNTKFPQRVWMDDRGELYATPDAHDAQDAQHGGSASQTGVEEADHTSDRGRGRGRGRGKGRGRGRGRGRGGRHGQAYSAPFGYRGQSLFDTYAQSGVGYSPHGYGYGSPMQGPMPGPMGGPMPGPMGGPMPGPMGGPMPGPMGGPMPGPMGGPMGGVYFPPAPPPPPEPPANAPVQEPADPTD